jgi:hypothetical protein
MKKLWLSNFIFNYIFKQRPIYFLISLWIFFVKKIQNHGYEHDHGLLWIKDAPIYGIILKNEEIENFVDMYIGCDVSLLPITLQNAQHQHIKKCFKKSHNAFF